MEEKNPFYNEIDYHVRVLYSFTKASLALVMTSWKTLHHHHKIVNIITTGSMYTMKYITKLYDTFRTDDDVTYFPSQIECWIYGHTYLI